MPAGAHRKKVLVAMSGGVDSSVAAALLQEDGYDVVGCFMRHGGKGPEEREDGACDPAKAAKAGHQGCCSLDDAADARLVAATLGVPLYVLNFERDFGRVIDYFVAEYNAGRTPNPCVRCNDWLKFGKLFDYASSIDADYVATGHYARIGRGPDGGALLAGRDAAKDQSYVLFGTPAERLGRMLLPIGELESKEAVRRVAREKGLPVFDKPDSQEICFVPDNDYAGLVKRRTPDRVAPGDIVDTAGRAIGRHEGHQHYTVGQRRGLASVARGVPLYVLRRDAGSNTITVGDREELLADGLVADQTNWLIDPPRRAAVRCGVKIRSNSRPVPARVRATAEDGMELRFDEPQPAVSPGQAAVCYDGERVIGGGWISEAI